MVHLDTSNARCCKYANGETLGWFCCTIEPEGVLFTDEFTDDMWNAHS